MDSPTVAQLESFLKKNNQRGARILSILGKNQQFYNAVTSPLGAELLQELVNIMEERLSKIVDDKANENEKAEFRIAKMMAMRWADRIANHQKHISEIVNTDKKEEHHG